jgi:hypothetical protein
VVFSDTPVSSTNKTDDRHNITEILLKVALHTINLNLLQGRHGLACMVFDLGQTNPVFPFTLTILISSARPKVFLTISGEALLQVLPCIT